MHGLHWPDEVLSYVVVALAVGFPVVIALAWIFDVNAGPHRADYSNAGADWDAAGFGPRRHRRACGCSRLYLVLRGARAANASGCHGEAIPSIAVLPFADMSAGKDQEYFSDGIAEEILNALAHVENLRVIGRTSSFSFKGKNEDLRTIGQKLNVGSILEGSVRKAGDQIRITTQLINAVDGSHVWSETYDRKLNDVFAVQGEIAKAVVAALKVKLLPGEHQPNSGVKTASAEAYEQYLLGSQLTATYNVADVQRAIPAFEKAVTLDPTMAAGWARLSVALWWMNHSAETRRRAIEAADRSVALDPFLAEGYAARSLARNDLQWDFAGAAADDARALALAPNAEYVLVLHCITSRSRGLLAESRAGCEKAIEVDPLAVGARNNLTITHLASGDIARARAINNRVLELSPGSATGRRMRCELDFWERNGPAVRDHCAVAKDESDRRIWKERPAVLEGDDRARVGECGRS